MHWPSSKYCVPPQVHVVARAASRSSCLPGTPRSSSCRCQHPRSGIGSLRTTSRRYKLLQPVRFQRLTRLSSGQSCTPCRTTSSQVSRRSGLPDTCIRSVRSTEGMSRLTCSGTPCTRHPHKYCVPPQVHVVHEPSQRSSCLPGTPRSSPCRCQHPRPGNGSLRTTSRRLHALAVSPPEPSVDGIAVAAFVWPVLHGSHVHVLPLFCVVGCHCSSCRTPRLCPSWSTRSGRPPRSHVVAHVLG